MARSKTRKVVKRGKVQYVDLDTDSSSQPSRRSRKAVRTTGHASRASTHARAIRSQKAIRAFRRGLETDETDPNLRDDDQSGGDVERPPE